MGDGEDRCRAWPCATWALTASMSAVDVARKTILALEDNDRRIEMCAPLWPLSLVSLNPAMGRHRDHACQISPPAPQCLADLPGFFLPDGAQNPGTGMDSVNMLLRHQPASLVIFAVSHGRRLCGSCAWRPSSPTPLPDIALDLEYCWDLRRGY